METFQELLSDFYHYMITEGNITPKTSSDYISRLHFLSADYRIDTSITLDYINYIIAEENIKRKQRTVYVSPKAMTDFRSGLMKFYAFVKSDYNKRLNNSILREEKLIKNTPTLNSTEKQTIIQARIGQGLFRKQLIDYWHGCSISNCNLTWLLVASHIKPWKDSNNAERINLYNGLLLLPNYDKLFDKGYISFRPQGQIIISKHIDKENRDLLNINHSTRLIKVEEQHKSFLKYHNDNYFIS